MEIRVSGFRTDLVVEAPIKVTASRVDSVERDSTKGCRSTLDRRDSRGAGTRVSRVDRVVKQGSRARNSRRMITKGVYKRSLLISSAIAVFSWVINNLIVKMNLCVTSANSLGIWR